MKFLGMGVPELLIILVVVLLIFGPKNLPKLGSAIGKSVKSLREGMTSDEGKPEIDLDEDEEVEEEPKKKAVKAAKRLPPQARNRFFGASSLRYRKSQEKRPRKILHGRFTHSGSLLCRERDLRGDGVLGFALWWVEAMALWPAGRECPGARICPGNLVVPCVQPRS